MPAASWASTPSGARCPYHVEYLGGPQNCPKNYEKYRKFEGFSRAFLPCWAVFLFFHLAGLAAVLVEHLGAGCSGA